MQPTISLSSIITDTLEKRNFTPQSFALSLGISPHEVEKACNNEGTVETFQLELWSRALGCNLFRCLSDQIDLMLKT